VSNGLIHNSTPIPLDPVTDVWVNESMAQFTACCIISNAFSQWQGCLKPCTMHSILTHKAYRQQ